MSTQFRVGPAHEPDRIRLGPAAASGAEGVLYRGYVELADGPVALAVKMLHPGHLPRLEEWTARWRDQVRLLRQVEIPGLVAVRGGFVGPLPHAPGQADESTATLYLVMEWVDGVSLDQWARSLVDPEPEQLLLALVPVAAALDLLHSGAATGGQAVVHRDVKPANILVRPEGDTILVDLGSVRGVARGHGRASLVGTAGYIAPEVLADGRYGSAADRYSLGAVAYFLLTGEEPVARPEPGELRRRLLDASLVHGRVDLADHIATMLDPDPDHRPECLANWVAQLRRSSLVCLSGELPIPQRAPARNPSAPPALAADSVSRTRRRRVAGVAAAIAAMTLAVAAFAAAPAGDDPNLVAAERDQSVATVAGETTTTSTTLSGPATSGEVPTTVAPVTTALSPVPTTSAVTSTVPAVAPPTTPAADSGPRAVPVITVANESYTVEVYGAYEPGTRRMTGSIRRSDVRAATSTGTAPSDYTASWTGDFGRRCLTAGGSGANMSGANALPHVYGFGVVGYDAVKVELVTAAGTRLPATLAQQPFASSVRWWIADYGNENVTSVVATDASGQTWTVRSGPAGIYGQTGC